MGLACLSLSSICLQVLELSIILVSLGYFYFLHLFQVLLFSGVPLLCTLFIALEHHGHVTLPQAVFSNAAVCGIYAFLIQGLAFCLRNRRSKSREIEQVRFVILCCTICFFLFLKIDRS